MSISLGEDVPLFLSVLDSLSSAGRFLRGSLLLGSRDSFSDLGSYTEMVLHGYVSIHKSLDISRIKYRHVKQDVQEDLTESGGRMSLRRGTSEQQRLLYVYNVNQLLEDFPKYYILNTRIINCENFN